jgi:hypothetical protein
MTRENISRITPSVKAQASSSNLCSEIRHKSILTYRSRLIFRLLTSTKGTLMYIAVTLVEVGEPTVFLVTSLCYFCYTAPSI